MRNVLAAIDFSESSSSVIDWAKSLSQAYGARLHLVHVAAPDPDFVGYEPGPQHVRDQAARAMRAEHHRLLEVAEQLHGAGIDATAHCLQGGVVDAILKKAADSQADVIVVGSHGHGALYRMVLGSVSQGVVRGSTCPVLVVPEPRRHTDI